MRLPLLLMEYDDNDGRILLSFFHSPGCSHGDKAGKPEKVFDLPPQAAQAIVEGSVRVVNMTGTPVEPTEPEVRRPAELNDLDRKRDA